MAPKFDPQAVEDAVHEWALNYEMPTTLTLNPSTPKQIGESLRDIRDHRLYRGQFDNFYVYCARRFGLNPKTVDQYISIANGIVVIPVKELVEKPKQDIELYVYFLEGGGLIKIGKAIDVRKRTGSIQNMSPIRLNVLGYIRGSQALEGQLHKRFSQYRRYGEWFEDCAEIRAYIAELRNNNELLS